MFSCQGSKKNSSGDLPPPHRSGQKIEMVGKEFTDFGASMDASGKNIVFLSGRSPHQGVFKAYKYKIAETATPLRLTSNDTDEEYLTKISPDGLWAAIASKNSDGESAIRLQGIADSKVGIDVGKEYSFIGEIIFTQSSPPVLMYQARKDSGALELNLVDFNLDSGGVPSIKTATKLEDYSEAESNLQFVTTSNFTGLISESFELSDPILNARAYKTGVLFAERKQSSLAALGKYSGVKVAGGKDGIVVAASAFAKDFKVVPEGDRENLGFVHKLHKIFKYDYSLNLLKEINTLQYEAKSFSSSTKAQVDMILGQELLACKSGDTVDYYVTSILFDTASFQKKVLIYDEQSPELVAGEFCSKKIEQMDKFDFQFEHIQLAANSTADEISLVYQTWHRGDDEIYHLSLTLSGGEIVTSVFTKVSNNLRP